MIGLAAALWLPDLVSHTLSLDGLVYANIALLLAQGYGSVWALPNYDLAAVPFIDHPPLAIYVTSLWHTLTGGAWWSEKVLTALALVISALLAWRLHRLLQADRPFWVVGLVFLLLPVSERVTGFYLETWLLPLGLGAVLCTFLARRKLVWCGGAAVCVYLACMTKGLVGLFTLAAPLAVWIWYGEFRRAFVIGLLIAVGVVLLLGQTLLFFPEALSFLDAYFHKQVLASISGDRPAEHGRLALGLRILGHVAVATVVCAVLVRALPSPDRRTAAWLCLFAAGTLPMLISARHYEFYLLPALPYLALAGASVVRVPIPVPRSVGTALAALVWVAAAALTGVSFGAQGDHHRDIQAADRLAALVDDVKVQYCDEADSLKVRAYLFRRHETFSVPVRPETAGGWTMCSYAPAEEQHGIVEVGPLKGALRLWQVQVH